MEILLIEESDRLLDFISCFSFSQDPLGYLDSFLTDENPYFTLEEEVILEADLKTEKLM